MTDIKTLEILAAKMREDAGKGWSLSPAAVRSIAEIIDKAIGAPLMWPSRVAGAQFADEYYRGSNDLRLAFNTGVKWAVERYSPTFEINFRYGQ